MNLNTDTKICDCRNIYCVLRIVTATTDWLLFDVIRTTLLPEPYVPLGLPVDTIARYRDTYLLPWQPDVLFIY